MEQYVPSSAHLRTLREACGLTAQAAADLVGVSLRSWQHWESPACTLPIKPDVRQRLNELLDRKLADLAGILADAAGQDRVELRRYLNDAALHRDHPDYPHGASLWNVTIAAAAERLGDRAVVVWG